MLRSLVGSEMCIRDSSVEADCCGAFVRGELDAYDRQHLRSDECGGHRLKYAPDNEERSGRRQATCRRSQREPHYADQEDSFTAEDVAQSTASDERDGKADSIARNNELQFRSGCLQVSAHCWQGNVYDEEVQKRQE